MARYDAEEWDGLVNSGPLTKIRGGTMRRIVLFVLFLLVLQESALRLLFPIPEIKGFNRSNYMSMPAETLSLPAIRSLNMVWKSAPDKAESTHRLNRYGFRGDEWKVQKEEGVHRVFFLGDSFMEGMMASDDETIPRSFADKARDMGVGVEVMNLGIMGTGFQSYAQIIVDATPIFRPDSIFLVIYANDINMNVFVKPPVNVVYYNQWKPRFLGLVSMVREKEDLPMRWNFRSRGFHSKGTDPASPWHGRENKLRLLVDPGIAKAMLDGEFNSSRVNGSYYLKYHLLRQQDYSRILSNSKSYAEENGAKLYVAYIPERGAVTSYYKQFEARYSLRVPVDSYDLTTEEYQGHRKTLAEQCKSLGIPFLDLYALIKREEDKGNHLHWDYDDHMRPAGYKLLGDALFNWWNAR